MIKVLFVCLGNICRSPMAELILKQMVKERGIENQFEIDSAATEGYNEIWHVGIHHGAREMLKAMHVPFTEHYSRQIKKADYARFDYIIAMDDNNIRDIKAIVKEDTQNCWNILITPEILKTHGIREILMKRIGILLKGVKLFYRI